MKNVYFSELVQHCYGLPIKIYLCQVEQNCLHWHTDIEFIYCLEGSLNVETEDGSYIIEKNHIVLMNKNKIHRLSKTHENNIVFILQIDLSSYTHYIEHIDNFVYECNSLFFPEHNYSQIIDLFWQYIHIFIKDDVGFIIRLRALTDSTILFLLDNCISKQTLSHTSKSSDETLTRLNQVFNYVASNYENPIPISTIASQLHISSYHFSHFFKSKTGYSFGNYLKQYRLEQSIKFLLQSDLTILEIANNCGFSSIQAYIKYFKSTYYLTPLKYRKKYASALENEYIVNTKDSEYTLIDPKTIFDLNTIF